MSRHARMTQAEYDAFKAKSGYREGQKIKTYYKPTKPAPNLQDANEKEREGLAHHAERRELNRSIRDKARKNRPFKEKIGEASGKIGSAVRHGAEKIKEVGGPMLSNIATNARRQMEEGHEPPRKSSSKRQGGRVQPDFGPTSMHIQAPQIEMPTAWMMGMGQEPEPERQAPVRRKKSRQRRAPVQRQEPAGPDWRELGGVPENVKRWMI